MGFSPIDEHENQGSGFDAKEILIPEIVLPGQISGLSRPSGSGWGRAGAEDAEMSLVCAILEQAILDLRKVGRRGGEMTPNSGYGYTKKSNGRLAIYVSAKLWFRSDSRHPFSFLDICDILQFEPNAVRSRLGITPEMPVKNSQEFSPALESENRTDKPRFRGSRAHRLAMRGEKSSHYKLSAVAAWIRDQHEPSHD